jgi:hypothetical protein
MLQAKISVYLKKALIGGALIVVVSAMILLMGVSVLILAMMKYTNVIYEACIGRLKDGSNKD